MAKYEEHEVIYISSITNKRCKFYIEIKRNIDACKHIKSICNNAIQSSNVEWCKKFILN